MILWFIAAFLAFFVKGLCGFANTLVFTSILTFTSTNINISPVEVLLGYPTNLIIAWKERRHLKLPVCIPITLLVLAGSIPGAFLLKNADASLLKFFLGILIILISLELLLRDKYHFALKQSKPALILCGLVTGLICGLFGIGALLAAYLNHITQDNDSFKANLCFIFFAENTFRILLYGASGIITFAVIRQVVILLPAMFAGLFLGMKCSQVLNDQLVRKIVIFLLILSGIFLIIRNIAF